MQEQRSAFIGIASDQGNYDNANMQNNPSAIPSNCNADSKAYNIKNNDHEKIGQINKKKLNPKKKLPSSCINVYFKIQRAELKTTILPLKHTKVMGKMCWYKLPFVL